MNLTKKNIKKICGIILFTVLVFAAAINYKSVFGVFRWMWGIIFTFVLGGIIAFILNIPMRSIERILFKSTSDRRKKYARPLSLIITLILVIAVIAGVVLIVVPQIGSTIKELTKTAEAFFPKIQNEAMQIFQSNQQIRDWIQNLSFNTNKIFDAVISFLQNGAGDMLSGTFSAAKAVVSGIAAFFIALIFACYVLTGKEKLARQCDMLIKAAFPEKAVFKIEYVAKLCSDTFSSFIAGQCLEALILGTMFFIVMSVIRLPYPLLIGVLVAFTALIPIFGAFIGCAVGAFLIVMVSPMKALIFIITFLVLQQVEGNFIYPKVVGGSIGLPPIWVLAAVTIGSSLMGVAGMLIFIPLTSVIYTLIREWTYKRLEMKKNLASEAAEESPQTEQSENEA
ncbi:MAG: AI-2E family transporter [Clostridia bacterium]|nr:AI-2E family transporter [Clostridia bacterium]